MGAFVNKLFFRQPLQSGDALMPTYHLNGIPVEFPHDAYPCQLTYMTHVLSALSRAEHALLESPTGTGKTLSLLCAALAWRATYLAKNQLHQQQLPGDEALFSPASSLSLLPLVPNGPSPFSVPNEPSILAYKHSKNAKEHNLHRLESALSSALASHTAATPPSKPPLIVYASRTHSQLAQVIKELRRTSYRLQVAVVGSREQLCIHPDVRKLPSSSVQSTVCQRLIRKKTCEFFNHVAEGIEHLTQYGREHPNEIFDMEDLIKFSSQHK